MALFKLAPARKFFAVATCIAGFRGLNSCFIGRFATQIGPTFILKRGFIDTLLNQLIAWCPWGAPALCVDPRRYLPDSTLFDCRSMRAPQRTSCLVGELNINHSHIFSEDRPVAIAPQKISAQVWSRPVRDRQA